jgi:ribose transport system ATP-binding protein
VSGAPSPETSRTLRLLGVGKSFPGVRALDNVNLEVSSGEIVALVGENGAGKSTLVKILAGVHEPDDGSVEIDGQRTRLQHPDEARAAGISVIHQHFSLVPVLSVAENMFLGREPRFGIGGLMRRRAMRREAARLLEELELDVDADAPVESLTVGQRQMVEVGKAMLGQAWLMVMDEPTSALSNRERDQLYALIERLVDRGVAILYISHKMEEIFHLAPRAVVLRDGRHVGDADLSATTEADLVEMMVGRQVDEVFPRTEAQAGEVVLRVENLCDGGLLRDASFSVKSGEIVVLSGLMGSGRSEVLECVFGLSKFDGGKVEIAGEELEAHSPQAVAARGVAFIPEDRHEAGIVPTMSTQHNLGLIWTRRHNTGGVLNPRAERTVAESLIGRLNVRPPNADSLVESLSGGNQQKVVLGKWLATDPKILLLDEPTRGVDVGAKSEIHRLVGELKTRGVAILMVSSELPEVLGVADRIVVMHEGRSVAELGRGATEQEVMRHALGGVERGPAEIAGNGARENAEGDYDDSEVSEDAG